MAEAVKKKFYQKWWFWVIVAVILLGAIGSCGGGDVTDSTTKSEAEEAVIEGSTQVEATTIPTEEPTPVPTESVVIEDLDELPALDLSLEKWIENLNIWQAEIDDNIVKSSDLEISNGIFTLYLNDYVYYIGQLDSDDNIISVMVGGVGDGTTESGFVIINSLGGLITSVHPEYTPDQRGDVLEALGILDNEMATTSSATIDGTTYSFMYSEQLGVMMYASPVE